MMPRPLRCLLLLFALLCAALAGCTSSLLNTRSQSPERAEEDDLESQTKLVGDYAYAYGTNYVRVEGPVLITWRAPAAIPPPVRSGKR